MNYSVCFSGRADYFSGIRSFAEPAVRFYNKLYLAPFTREETGEYVQAIFGLHPNNAHELKSWLFEKTLGHPFFLVFVSRQLLAYARGSPPESPAHHWPEISQRLETEKFSCDLGQLSEKEIELLLAVARSPSWEFTRHNSSSNRITSTLAGSRRKAF